MALVHLPHLNPDLEEPPPALRGRLNRRPRLYRAGFASLRALQRLIAVASIAASSSARNAAAAATAYPTRDDKIVFHFRLDNGNSIQKTEQPKRDLVPKADIDPVIDDITVRGVGNLLKCLAFPANLKQVGIIHHEVPSLGISQSVPI